MIQIGPCAERVIVSKVVSALTKFVQSFPACFNEFSSYWLFTESLFWDLSPLSCSFRCVDFSRLIFSLSLFCSVSLALFLQRSQVWWEKVTIQMHRLWRTMQFWGWCLLTFFALNQLHQQKFFPLFDLFFSSLLSFSFFSGAFSFSWCFSISFGLVSFSF